MSKINLEGFDHIVFTVQSIEETCAFYTRVLGLTVAAGDPCERRSLKSPLPGGLSRIVAPVAPRKPGEG